MRQPPLRGLTRKICLQKKIKSLLFFIAIKMYTRCKENTVMIVQSSILKPLNQNIKNCGFFLLYGI